MKQPWPSNASLCGDRHGVAMADDFQRLEANGIIGGRMAAASVECAPGERAICAALSRETIAPYRTGDRLGLDAGIRARLSFGCERLYLVSRSIMRKLFANINKS
jgi:hypothetical protein